MTTRAGHKARGNGFETAVVAWARSRGWHAERLPLSGARDQGDLYLYDPVCNGYHVIECKAPGATGKVNLAGWLREAQVEAGHFAEARGLPAHQVTPWLLVKKFRAPIDHAYLIAVPDTIAARYLGGIEAHSVPLASAFVRTTP